MPELMEPPCEIVSPTLRVRILPDQDCESPAESDCQWKHFSFYSRHRKTDGKDHDDFFPDGKPSLGLRRKLEVGLAFVLDYYEHGLCRWSRSGRGTQCRWDTSRSAGLLLWEHKPDEIGAKTYEDRAKDADQFLKCYTDWCNGHCYGYVIEDADGEDVDSCWGFIGDDVLRGVDDACGDRPYEIIGNHFAGEKYKE